MKLNWFTGALGVCVMSVSLVMAQPAPYQELTDPALKSAWKLKPGVYASFASTNERFAKNEIPVLAKNQRSLLLKAWKGERVHAQALVWSTKSLKSLSLQLGELKDKSGSKIDPQFAQANFVRYVMTDGLSKSGIGCAIEPKLDSSLVADVIDQYTKSISVNAEEVRPVWISVAVPEETKPGTYTASLNILDNGQLIQKLQLNVQVLNHILPAPSKWSYHLDLWQNPYATARITKLEPFSAAHMEAMKPEMQRLANAGQKAITASIIHDPWNSQTYDIYQSMIKWVKKKDGTWTYDYTNFDKWVNFMMGFGVDKYINCYSMIPWNLKFYYFDEASGKEEVVVAKPGTEAYNNHWKPMLVDFARHLKSKGWFEKTTIAMDEREMDDMQKAIALIKSADAGYRVSLAGNFHKELEADLVDYSIASAQTISKELLADRDQKKFNTTFYTCCAEGFPNTFTFSPPAESSWLAWHAANKGYDGYLRWAYNCWNKDPLKDSRFGSWSGGDTYLIYPDNRTSIRFEKLVEGIQDFEKMKILKAEFQKANDAQKLAQLETMLKPFEIERLKAHPAAGMLESARQQLNNY